MSMAKKREHDLVWLSSKCQEKGCLHKYRNIVDLEVQRDVIPTSEAMDITHAKRTINNTKVFIDTNKHCSWFNCEVLFVLINVGQV